MIEVQGNPVVPPPANKQAPRSDRSPPPCGAITGRSTRLVLYDSHAMFLQGMRQLLERQSNFRVLAGLNNARQLARHVLSTRPDIVIADMNANDGVDLSQVIAATRAQAPALKFILLSGSGDPGQAAEAERLGAHAYIPKQAGASELIDAIARVCAGEVLLGDNLPPGAMACLPRQPEPVQGGRLTQSETAILRELAAAGSNQEIAEALGITEKTVRNKLSAIYEKLGLHNRTQAALYALSRGIAEL